MITATTARSPSHKVWGTGDRGAPVMSHRWYLMYADCVCHDHHEDLNYSKILQSRNNRSESLLMNNSFRQGLGDWGILGARNIGCLMLVLNPFTLCVLLESIVCHSHTFQNNLGITRNFTKYLKEMCCLASDLHFSFKYFMKTSFC